MSFFLRHECHYKACRRREYPWKECNMTHSRYDPQMEREIVKVDNPKLFKPIFYHESEIILYRVLIELFPTSK
jgi:hypothetical protein